MRTIRPPFTLSLLLAVAAAPLTQAAIRCYFPNGEPNPEDVPCDPNAAVSMCCSSRDACLSSGLCLNPGTGPHRGISFVRGSCTDQTWRSPICPQSCRINQDSATNSHAFNFSTGGVLVWECNNEGFREPAAYCCESAAEKNRCCHTSTALFSLPAATLGNALPVQTFTSTNTRMGMTTTTTRGMGMGTTESTATPTPGTDPAEDNDDGDDDDDDGDDDGEETQTNTTNIDTPLPTSALDSLDSPGGGGGGGGMNEGAKIGLGVGIGLGFLLLVTAAIVVGYLRAKKAVGGQGVEAGGFYTGGGGGGSGGEKQEVMPSTAGKEASGQGRVMSPASEGTGGTLSPLVGEKNKGWFRR